VPYQLPISEKERMLLIALLANYVDKSCRESGVAEAMFDRLVALTAPPGGNVLSRDSAFALKVRLELILHAIKDAELEFEDVKFVLKERLASLHLQANAVRHEIVDGRLALLEAESGIGRLTGKGMGS
jgi:hypothetical protein